MTISQGPHPNTFYRVSLKAIIRNDKDEVLVVKEKGSYWSLPGGGLDHGESDVEALKRELKEEVDYDGDFSFSIAAVQTMFVENKNAWLMWIVYEVSNLSSTEFIPGVDADEVAFIDPNEFKNSTKRSERLVYKYCVDPTITIDSLT